MLSVFDRTTGLFIGGTGFNPDIVFDTALYAVLDLPAYPNARTQRWDGASGIRPATAAEIAAYDAAQTDAEAQARADDKLIKAILIYLVQRLNELRTQPTTSFAPLTATAVRTGVVAIYKTL